jgi:hypothetical protein
MAISVLLNNSDKEIEVISIYAETKYNDDGSSSPMLRFLFDPEKFDIDDLYNEFMTENALDKLYLIETNDEISNKYEYTNYSKFESISFNTHIISEATDTTPRITQDVIEIVVSQLSYTEVMINERNELIDLQAEVLAELICG